MKKVKKFRNTVFLIAVIIFAIVAISGYLLYNKPHRDVLKAKADFTISAHELLTEFEADANRATAKYNDKILTVTGKVESVKVTPSSASIQLSSDGSFYGVNCSFSNNESSNILEIKPGSEIQVKGECKGYIDDVILNNCFLIK
jgi:amino acid permease